jgi:hypothetical protein
MALEIQVLALDRCKNVLRINQLMGYQPFYYYWISNGNTNINK